MKMRRGVWVKMRGKVSVGSDVMTAIGDFGSSCRSDSGTLSCEFVG